jgi:hypothetical protein
VAFDVQQQEKYDRTQVLVRIVILLVLSVLAGAFGWMFGVLYLAIPVVAFVLIAQRGAERYIRESGENMALWLRYIVGFYAYMGMLTDKLPGQDAGPDPVRFEIAASGTPSAGGALLRIITLIPHLIVLSLIGVVSFVLAVVAAILILVQETYPKGIFDFQLGYMRWYARVLGHLASLVPGYPPFALDTEHEAGAAALAPPADA